MRKAIEDQVRDAEAHLGYMNGLMAAAAEREAELVGGQLMCYQTGEVSLKIEVHSGAFNCGAFYFDGSNSDPAKALDEVIEKYKEAKAAWDEKAMESERIAQFVSLQSNRVNCSPVKVYMTHKTVRSGDTSRSFANGAEVVAHEMSHEAILWFARSAASSAVSVSMKPKSSVVSAEFQDMEALEKFVSSLVLLMKEETCESCDGTGLCLACEGEGCSECDGYPECGECADGMVMVWAEGKLS